MNRLEIKNSQGRKSEFTVTWLLRFLWLSLPLTTGSTLSNSLQELDNSLRTTISVGLWILWAISFLATLIPKPLPLAWIRLGGPTAFSIGTWATVTDGISATNLLTLVTTTVVAGISVSAPIGDHFVDGDSYGNERRFLLRAPGAVVTVLGPLAWAITIAGISAGPLLIAAGFLTAGIPVCAIGLPTAGLAIHAFYQLSRRWIVLVPAGLVLHDHLAMKDPTMLPRTQIFSIEPAPLSSKATDLTQGAFGLALEVQCYESVNMRPSNFSEDMEETTENMLQSFLFTAARPDVFLAEAKLRKLPNN